MCARIRRPGHRGVPGTFTNGYGDASIQGFATNISVNVSGTISFKIATNATAYTIDIYRLGYYGGNGARHITTISPSATLPQNQPDCLTDSTTGLFDCGNWGISASWAVPSNATSGIYIALLTRTATGGKSHIPFVVRDDSKHSDIVVQTSDTTWQAYNWYGGTGTGAPNQGRSLYGCSGGFNLGCRAFKVSYNRPIDTRGSYGGPSDYLFSSEYPLVRWLEANGYNVTYISDVDTDQSGSLLLNHKVYVSSGHDEYWSAQQRANVENARAAGVDLAFFTANQTFWKTRWESSIDGSNTSYRTLVTYKETNANAVIDPSDPPTWTGTWRDARFSPPADGGRPENALAGTLFMVNGPSFGSIIVPQTDGLMRFWRNTQMASISAGQSFTFPNGTLGEEINADVDNGFRPAGLFPLSTTNYLANGTLLLDEGNTFGSGQVTHHMTLYRHSSGALVFSAGTFNWAWGLDSVHDVPNALGSNLPTDANMRQATVNLLADMSVQPGSLTSGLLLATASTDTTPPTSVITSPSSGSILTVGNIATIMGTATDSGGGLVGAVEVSTDGGASWHPAIGRGNWTYSWTPLSNGSITIKSRAVDDSGNVETPSAGAIVTVSSDNGYSLWNSTTTPAVITSGDTNAVELGVKFTADFDGYVTSLRFYKGPDNLGTHTGSLWTISGSLLATATFTGESSSGWQQVNLSSPVQITAGTAYVVSYHTNVGEYSYSRPYFTAQYDNAPLHALQDGANGGNGVYVYGASSTFPTNSSQSANYWADLVYVPASSFVAVSSISVNPSSVIGGASSTGSVTLSGPAPAGGVTVALSSSDPSVIPSSVTVAAGATTANFAVTTHSVATTTSITISGTFHGTQTTTLTVLPLAIVSVTLNPSTVIGGTSSTGTVTLGAPAPAGGVVVPLSSNNAAAIIPNSVTVAAGSSSATFTATTIPVSSSTPVTISGTLNGTATGSLTVNPAGVATVSMNPPSVTGGASSTGTVALSGQAPAGGANVTLSSDKAAASVPVSVNVPEGAIGATFTITTGAVTAVTTATIRATYNGTQSGTLTVNPPVLALVSLNPASVVGGFSSTGTVKLTGPAPAGGISVALSSGNTAVATVPASVNVAAGQTTSATFTVSTSAVSLPASANITGNYGGSHSASLTVYPTLGLSAISVSPVVVTGGHVATGTVTLSNPAPGGGAVVALSGSNNTAAVEDSSVTVAGGATTATFNVYTNFVKTATPVTITGSYNGTQSATIMVNPAGASLLTIWPATTTPLNNDSNQTTPGEFGLRFSSDTDGYVLGVRFYKGTSNGGTHVGNLWSSSGQLLATATFTAETASGWQQVFFSNPVKITANTSYIASYYSPSGDYSYTDFYFASGSAADNAPLHAPPDSPSAPNGVFASGPSSSFPNNTFNSYNYWVDVVFAPTPTNLTFTTPALADGFQTGFYFQNLGASGGTQPYTWTLTSGSMPPGLSLSSSGLISGVATGTGSFNFTVRVTDSGASPQSITQPLGIYFAPSDSCPCTIWPSDATPLTADSGATAPGEFGVRFHADADGDVVGIRFYKGPLNTGTHVGNLWSNSGQLLGTATFAAPVSNGWQQVNFSSPVHITANTEYIASYYSPTGDYSYTDFYFAVGAGSDNAPLHVPADSPSTPNGVYALGGTSTFPNNTFNSYNYWVDLVFNAIPGPTLASVTISPLQVTGGTTATGTVTLNGPAPQGGETVSLSSSNSGIISAPSTVTVPAGATSATFPVTTYSMIFSTAATITATGNGIQSGTVTVNPPSPASVTVNPSTVNAGYSSSGTVTLTGPAPIGDWMISLSSNNPAVTVPGSVTIPEGLTSVTFIASTGTVGVVTPVTISATGDVTKTTTLTVNPFTLAVTSVSLNPTSVAGSSSSVGTIHLNGPAPAGGATVTLSSNNAAATVPGTVTVLAASSTANFTVATTSVATVTTPTITATFNGTATAQLTINPIAVASVSLNPTSVTGGSATSTGTVTLNGPAPSGGIQVALASSNTAVATVVSPVTVLAGSTTANFTVTTLSVVSQATSSITATLNGSSSATLTVTPAATAVVSVSLNPTSIVGGVPGQNSTGTVTLNGTAPSGGMVVTLTSGNTGAATVPASVTVPANASSTTFTVTPIAVLATTNVSISAKVGATTAQSATLTVVPPSIVSVTMNPHKRARWCCELNRHRDAERSGRSRSLDCPTHSEPIGQFSLSVHP